MTISEVLKSDIESYASSLRTTNELFRQAERGQVCGAAIAAYLSNLHYLIRNTDVNMNLARARADELGQHQLAAFFARKADEERGHERWAERDLSRLHSLFGVEHDGATSRSLEDLVRYLQAIIAEEPKLYLAYLLLAEYLTVLMGPDWLAMLEERCGIPAQAMTVIVKHVELDRDHVADGLREIDELVGDESRLGDLRRALQESMRYFDGFWDELSRVRAAN